MLAWRSTGRSNQDMTNKLKENGLIKSETVENAFRLVDRGIFVPKGEHEMLRTLPFALLHQEGNDIAYVDAPCKIGNIHMSAPHMYATILEALELAPQQAVLNVGSGSGYVCSMIASIVGNKGIVHGIELLPDVVEHANKCTQQWLQHLDESTVGGNKRKLDNSMNEEENKNENENKFQRNESESQHEHGQHQMSNAEQAIVDAIEFEEKEVVGEDSAVTAPAAAAAATTTEGQEASATEQQQDEQMSFRSTLQRIHTVLPEFHPLAAILSSISRPSRSPPASASASASASAPDSSAATSSISSPSTTYFHKLTSKQVAHPQYVQGDAFLLDVTNPRKYDRIYVGACATIELRDRIRQLLAIDGIMVGPFDDCLQRVIRKSEEEYEIVTISEVGFAPLVEGHESSSKPAEFQWPIFTRDTAYMFPAQFLHTMNALLILQNRNDCLPGTLPLDLWMHIGTFLDRNWFTTSKPWIQSMEHKLEQMKQKLATADTHLQQQQYEIASRELIQALHIVEYSTNIPDVIHDVVASLKVQAYELLIQCYQKLQRNDQLIVTCTALLRVNPNHVSTLIARARAHVLDEEYELALHDAEKAQSLDEENNEIETLIETIRTKVEEERQSGEGARRQFIRYIIRL